MASSQIEGLQVLRAAAALAVVAHHAALATDAFVSAFPAGWMRAFDLGALGVDFFFVLSGFIIMHAHGHQAGERAATGRYLFKRLTRILPAYWPVGLGVLALYAALPGLSASGGREYSVISSVLLLPAALPPALSVAWTLVHELMFYALFLLWFVSQRVFWVGLAAWAGAIVAAQWLGGADGWLRYPLSVLNIEFMFGVLAAVLYRRGALQRGARTLVAAGALLSCGVLVLMHQQLAPSQARLLLALALAALVLGLAHREHQHPAAWPALLLALGNASYSIYLIHNPLLSLTQRAAGKLDMPWPVALIAGAAIAVLCGWVYHVRVEKPLLQGVRRWRGGET